MGAHLEQQFRNVRFMKQILKPLAGEAQIVDVGEIEMLNHERDKLVR
jgi:hypothetical protein